MTESLQSKAELYNDLKAIYGLDPNEEFIRMHIEEGLSFESAVDLLESVKELSSQLLESKIGKILLSETKSLGSILHKDGKRRC